jgi:hypothetical protein
VETGFVAFGMNDVAHEPLELPLFLVVTVTETTWSTGDEPTPKVSLLSPSAFATPVRVLAPVDQCTSAMTDAPADVETTRVSVVLGAGWVELSDAVQLSLEAAAGEQALATPTESNPPTTTATVLPNFAVTGCRLQP